MHNQKGIHIGQISVNLVLRTRNCLCFSWAITFAVVQKPNLQYILQSSIYVLVLSSSSEHKSSQKSQKEDMFQFGIGAYVC